MILESLDPCKWKLYEWKNVWFNDSSQVRSQQLRHSTEITTSMDLDSLEPFLYEHIWWRSASPGETLDKQMAAAKRVHCRGIELYSTPVIYSSRQSIVKVFTIAACAIV